MLFGKRNSEAPASDQDAPYVGSEPNLTGFKIVSTEIKEIPHDDPRCRQLRRKFFLSTLPVIGPLFGSYAAVYDKRETDTDS